MDVGSINSLTSATGAPLAQTNGPEVDRAKGESAANLRHLQYDAKAQQAAGIGQTDGDDHTTEDRYGDGRRAWEMSAAREPPSADNSQSSKQSPAPRDPKSQTGTLLDLSG